MTVFITHEVWETGTARDYPVLTHEFRGETREEAYAAYRAHYESDSILRRCVDDDEYATQDGEVVKCFTRWWYDDDDARIERIARAWIQARSGDRPAEPRREVQSAGIPATSQRGFRPRVIEGGADAAAGRPPGHEDHDPSVCDVRTG